MGLVTSGTGDSDCDGAVELEEAHATWTGKSGRVDTLKEAEWIAATGAKCRTTMEGRLGASEDNIGLGKRSDAYRKLGDGWTGGGCPHMGSKGSMAKLKTSERGGTAMTVDRLSALLLHRQSRTILRPYPVSRSNQMRCRQSIRAIGIPSS
jgi:hypothetical protein